ncbi:MAG: amidohydrolase family protein [Erysipelotrichaceae bacterium]|nr:amidohydrolase family protein [Erysipelotrichaceae bacterium]
MIIYCDRIISEQGIIDGYLKVEGSKITDLVRKDVEELQADRDYSGYTIIPGIFDTHNHGFMGWDPSRSEGGTAEIEGYCKALGSAAVTSIFPTVVDEDDSFALIAEVAKENKDGAAIMGIHSEGPYLNRVGEKGVDTGHPDIDLDRIERAIKNSNGLLKLMALAPELPLSKQAIRLLNKNGVRAAFAHSNQTYEEALESFKDGISVITHTANVMSGLHHRNMGGLGAAILNDDVYNELICDGLHVRNEMIEIIMRVKRDAFNKIMMISDNVHLGGLPAGQYMGPFGGEVTITDEGFCLTDTGRLAGSAKPVLYGMRNLVKNMNIPIETVSKMASLNPSLVYGFADRKGSIRNGKDADFAVIDDDFMCLYTYREGKKIYDHNTDTNLYNPYADNYKVKE